MKDERIDHGEGYSSIRTSRAAAIGEVMGILRKLKNGVDPKGEAVWGEDLAYHLVGAGINLKALARSDCHQNQIAHARMERRYMENVEEMVSDAPAHPAVELKMRLMGVREPDIQAFDDLPISSVPSGLYDLTLSAEEARELFLLGVTDAEEMVVRTARLAYNARAIFGAVCEEYGADPEALLDTADEAVQARADETGARDLLEDNNSRLEDDDDVPEW